MNEGVLDDKKSTGQHKWIIIDGSNVAFSYTVGNYFHYKGIQLCVDYFKSRGFHKIKVILPYERGIHKYLKPLKSRDYLISLQTNR